jgi:competence protein ComEC
MGDRAVVALALAAGAGAWVARPLPLVPVVVLVAVALAQRRPALLMVAVALAASTLGARSWDGLHPPALGQWSGVATLVGDPAEVAGALRADVRIGGKRVEAWALGASARALRERLSGERVQLRGLLSPVPADARQRLARRHVAARMTVQSASLASAGDVPSRLANGLRRTLLRGAEVLAPGSRALYAGFVLGDDRDQRPEVTDDFRASGLSHLLVVSGQNVAFVLALLGPFLGRLRLGGRLAGGLAVLVLFGILTRWEPSVLRAVAMAALTLLAAALGRPASTLRVLSLAVTGLILVDPLLVHSLGFLLSVGACAGIALFSARLTARLPGPRPVAGALGVTLAAQLGVLPILVPVFGGLPVAALPANLLGAPVAGPLMMWGMAAGLVAGWAGQAVAGVLHWPTGLMIRWVAGVAHWGAAAPLGQLRAVHVAGLGVAVAAGVAAHRRRWRPGVVVAGVVGAAFALAPAVAVLRPAAVDGRSVVPGARLWRSAGASVLVVDDLRASPEALLSSLHQADVRTLDVLVVTRAGAAAATDVRALLSRFPPRLVLAPAGHRLPGEVVVPPPGSEVAAGGVILTLHLEDRRLAVSVTTPGAHHQGTGSRSSSSSSVPKRSSRL